MFIILLDIFVMDVLTNVVILYKSNIDVFKFDKFLDVFVMDALIDDTLS